MTKLTEKEQHKKFVEKSRELGCDEDENRFNATLKKISKHRPEKNGADKQGTHHPKSNP